jgi:hypothetical protein
MGTIVLFPLLACVCGHYGSGGKLQDLSFGIVNDEVGSLSDCRNQSVLSVQLNNFQCTFEKISCRFINAIDDNEIKKVFSLKSF